MIKKILFAALLLAAVCTGYGQSAKSRSSISLSTGIALPVGDFGKKDIDDPSSGFAKLGPVVQAMYRFPANKRFGIAVNFYTQLNPIDVKAMADEFSSATFYRPALFVGDGSTPPPTIPAPATSFRAWRFEEDKWFMAGLQVGVYGDWPLSNGSTSFTARLMTGATYVHTPKLQGTSNEATQSAAIHQESGHGIGFTSSAAAGFVHQLNKHLALKANVEYLNIPSVKFKDITAIFTTVVDNGGGGGMTATEYSTTGNVKQSISTLGLAVGLVLRL